MPQAVKTDPRLDLGSSHGLAIRPDLIGLAPLAEHRLGAAAAGGQPLEERAALVSQRDMPRLAGLGLADRDRADVGVEVRDGERA